jgi:glycosyltransferase involved in cell wall biosynthesis
MAGRPIRVALVQHVLAHYRKSVFSFLDQSDGYAFTFFTSGKDVDGIAHLPSGTIKRQRTARMRQVGPLYWQSGIVALAASDEFDVLVLSGIPHHISTWVAAALARVRGKPVLFWTHGWRRSERSLKGLLRLSFCRLADRLLVYSERGKRLALAAGYPSERVQVIYNSLDLDEADAVIAAIERGESPIPPPAAFFANPERPLIVCTARLTRLCRFDLLLQSAAILRDQGKPANILLIGDGPMRTELGTLAGDLKLDVHFTGAVYDEERLGNWLYHADLTVSPGKVGLTAIHSMMYGAPVITHGKLDEQMPEVETVIEGETGALFKQSDERDLARVIAAWLDKSKDRAYVRKCCRSVIADKWNPRNQAQLIKDAIEMALREPARKENFP